MIPLAFVAACGSHPPAQDGQVAQSGNPAPAAELPAWQAQRVRYMDCVQAKADAELPGKAPPQQVAATALDACKLLLDTMRDNFRDYLGAQMTSSHGKAGARDAAERVRTDTQEKARAYLTRYVEYERYARKR